MNAKSEGTDKGKPSSLAKYVKILLAFAVTAVFVVWIGHTIEDPKKVWSYMGQADLFWLVLLVPVSMASHLLRAWRWRRFIGRPVSLFYSFTSLMIGYVVNNVLPKVGEAVRVVNMNRMTKVPLARLIATLLAERMIDVICLVLLLGVSLLMEGERIREHFPELTEAGEIPLIGACLGLAMLFFIALKPKWVGVILGGIFRRIHKGLGDKVEALAHQGAEGLAFLRKPSQAVPALIETAGIWALYWVVFLIGLEAFGLMEVVGYQGGTVTFSMATVALLLPAAGAVGPYHKFGADALTLFYSVDPDLSIASITIIHAMLFFVIGGVGGMMIWGIQIFVHRRSLRTGSEK